VSADLIFKNKKFGSLLWTQFIGALNDNYFKNALVMLITFRGVSLWGASTESIVALASAIFILPYFLFSSMAGQMADKFEKSKLIRIVKWIEVGIMAIASFGFYTSNFTLLLLALFMMGTHSTFFGPIKYSIIPELVSESHLTAGNAYVEVGTFLAILIGTIAGGMVVGVENSDHWIVSGLLALSLVGLILAYRIPQVPRGLPDLKLEWNPLPQTFRTIKMTVPHEAVFNSILGISWFWFLGAVILSLLPVYCKKFLGTDEIVVTLFLASFTIGIAIGAVICEKLSYERVEIGLVPWGSLGMSLFLVDLALQSVQWQGAGGADAMLTLSAFLDKPGAVHIAVDLLMIAFFGGLFTVPLYTLIQQRSPREMRSRVVAANNILNSLFMVVASLMLMGLYKIGLQIPEMFLLLAVMNAVVAVYIYSIVPEFTLRFLSWMLARMVYRLNVVGHNHIPKEGAALLICNHVSFIDWLVIAAAVKRPIRFVMYYRFFELPLIRYLFRHARVIPIAGAKENPEIFQRSFELVSEQLRQGELVCIFPEGSLTKDGEIHEFKKGVEHIINRDAVPIVPMALTGMWGSIFSHKDNPAFKKIPRRILASVKLKIAEPISNTEVKAQELEVLVKSLLKEAA
jgi:1-acyl-sn-glycerol-3-phosphate acyltransferase